VALWSGARVGYERLGGTAVIRIDPGPVVVDNAPFEAERWYAVGVLGLGVTFHPITLAVELDAGYQRGKGSIRLDDGTGTRVRHNATLDGISVTPGAALVLALWK
jgi:hypothetical protein